MLLGCRGTRIGGVESLAGSQPSDVALVYGTDLGKAYVGYILAMLKTLDDGSVDLVMTSPPFALARPKDYGNVAESSYIDWFLPYAREFHRVLRPTGSIVLDLGAAWLPGRPFKSIYQYKLLIALCEMGEIPFSLAQDFFWYNEAKLRS